MLFSVKKAEIIDLLERFELTEADLRSHFGYQGGQKEEADLVSFALINRLSIHKIDKLGNRYSLAEHADGETQFVIGMGQEFYKERGLLSPDEQYKALCNQILHEAKERKDRTGVGTLSIFGHQMRFDLSQGFPLLTRKRVHFGSVLKELLWLISGSTNNNDLLAMGCTIWNEWAGPNGELGPVYGKQWRKWQGADGRIIDQLANAIETIKKNPTSRRIIVSAWNVSDIDAMALPPCHSFFQFYVDPYEGTLSCQMYQRSADVFLGLPFNIASYSLLTMMVAQVCGLKAKHFIHTIGDAHIYTNHIPQIETMVARKASPMPVVALNGTVTDIDGFKFEDFKLGHYLPRPTIKGDVAV